VETARDLACADLWQASLERSLARRGKATRSSLELFHLQPERDLSCGDLLRESAMYSQLRRSAAARRPTMMTLPGAGGISALALLAATTLPGLLGGRGTSVRTARITYKAGEHGAGSPKTKVAEASVAAPTSAARPATATLAAASATTVPTYAADPHPALPAVHASRPAPAHVAHATVTTAHAAASTAHIAAAGDGTGGAGSGAASVSGGAAPAAQHSVAAASTQTAPKVHSTPAVHPTSTVHRAPSTDPTSTVHKTSTTVHRVAPTVHRVSTRVPRVPAAAKTTHAHTGGGAIEDTSSVGHPRPTTTAAHPKPVAKPHPVATTPPPAAKPAPAPVVAPGQYVNPLAGASVTPERIDQGVDYAGSGPLGAIGDGTITYVGTSGTGWPGAYVAYRLTDGPDAGRYVYYAEGISPAAGLRVGQSVHAGQKIAEIIAGDSNGIEIGWGAGVGTESYAMQQGQWQGGDDANSVPSPAGKDFSALIAELGGPPGKIEG
jgi:hypothetical protein